MNYVVLDALAFLGSLLLLDLFVDLLQGLVAILDRDFYNFSITDLEALDRVFLKEPRKGLSMRSGWVVLNSSKFSETS